MLVVYVGVASIVLSLLVLLGVEKIVARGNRQMAVAAETPASPQVPATAGGWRRGLIPALLVLMAVAIYFAISALTGQQAANVASLPAAESTPANADGDLDTLVKRLADKLASDPKSGDGWLLLAKTYGELRKFPEAAAAYEKAAGLLPPDATLLANWADSYVMAKGGKWDAAARRLLTQALALDPKHLKALALAGSEAFDRGDFPQAIALWKRMREAAPADSDDWKLADANIAEANSRLSGKAPAAATPAAAGEAPGVGGLITLSPKVLSKVSATDTVFVVAKSTEGGGPPLAVQRFKGSDFPIRFRLDDSSAIMPSRTISSASEVIISAMVSHSGQAEAKAGDVYGSPVKARLGADNLKLELDQVR